MTLRLLIAAGWLPAVLGGAAIAQTAAQSAAQSTAQPAAVPALQPTTITVATFPDLERAAKAALPGWAKLHPEITVKVVSLQYADHHTAMTTALATGGGLPDVMALDFRFIGKFAESQGLDDLSKPPYNAAGLAAQFVRYSFPQATSSSGALVALPTDIGPGTLL